MRCTACRQFRHGTCQHPEALRHYANDPETARTCAFFRSQHEVAPPRLRWTIPAPVWVSLLLLLVMTGLMGAVWTIDPRYFLGNPLRLERAVPTQATVGVPFTVTLRVTNLLHQTSTPFLVEISQDFLATADPAMPLPPPARINRYRDRLVFAYPPLPADGQRTLRLPFTPHRAGKTFFVARIYAPSNQLRHEIRDPLEVRNGRTVADRPVREGRPQ